MTVDPHVLRAYLLVLKRLHETHTTEGKVFVAILNFFYGIFAQVPDIHSSTLCLLVSYADYPFNQFGPWQKCSRGRRQYQNKDIIRFLCRKNFT